MQEAEKIWMNGALVNWPDARVHVLRTACTTAPRCSRASAPTTPRAAPRSSGSATTCAARAVGRDVPHAPAVHARRDPPGGPRGHHRQRARRLLHPADRAARLRHDGPVPARGAGRRGDGRVGVGRLPRRGRPRDGHPRQDLELAPHRLDTIPATAKAGGQYLNSILAKIETHKAGYQEAILLNEAGYVADGSGENLFLVRDGVLITPPVQASILEGITRASIIALAADEGIPVLEREVARGELYTADEVFITGTAAEVCPVNEVDDHALGPPGPDHAPAAGPLLRRHRGPRPALGRVARLRRGAGAGARASACARERAGRHLRHHPARRDAARGPACPWASSSPWRCGWPTSASTTSRPASRPATRSTGSCSGCSSARTSAPPAWPPSA